jgi:hypothetical protein
MSRKGKGKVIRPPAKSLERGQDRGDSAGAEREAKTIDGSGCIELK